MRQISPKRSCRGENVYVHILPGYAWHVPPSSRHCAGSGSLMQRDSAILHFLLLSPQCRHLSSFQLVHNSGFKLWGPYLSAIDVTFCNSKSIFLVLTKSTSFVRLCTARDSECQEFLVKRVASFLQNTNFMIELHRMFNQGWWFLSRLHELHGFQMNLRNSNGFLQESTDHFKYFWNHWIIL